MKTLRQMVWEAVAFELEAETPMVGPTFTIGDIAATVWEWNHEELKAAGVSKEDVEPVALEVLNHIDVHGWEEVRAEIRAAAEAREPELDREPEQRRTMPVDPKDLPF